MISLTEICQDMLGIWQRYARHLKKNKNKRMVIFESSSGKNLPNLLTNKEKEAQYNQTCKILYYSQAPELVFL